MVVNIMQGIKRYTRIWWILNTQTLQIALHSRLGAIIFIVAKMLRFSFFLLFVLVLVGKTKTIAGYSLWEMVFFFATFTLIDSVTQLFFREVYRFRSYVIKGFFDYTLTKPFSPLFRSLFGGADVLDIPLLFITIILIILAMGYIGGVTFASIMLYILLLINAFAIAFSFHVFVLAMGVLTTEVDNTIMLYRDVTQMGRVPIDIYREPVRGFLTFVIPVGIMMTFPAKGLMGFLSIQNIVFAFTLSILFLILSTWFWRFALKGYTSASS